MTESNAFRNRILLGAAMGFGALCTVAAVTLPFLWPQQAESESAFGGDRRLDVGVLAIAPYNPAGNYFPLAHYLQEELSRLSEGKNTVRVIPAESVGASPEAVERAREAIATKAWDVAFTTSPILSTVAENNGYTFVARMFPEVPQFEVAIVTRASSDIHSFDDITTGTRIALSDPGSELFYMSLYDLYGLTLRVDRGNTLEEISRKVKSDAADVGATVLSIAEQDPDLRILHVSRALPLSGVYVSPELTASQQELVRELLLAAPEEVRQKARYDAGRTIDYTHFQEVVSRAEEISDCTNWNADLVPLYCDAQEIIGQVNGFRLRDRAVHFTLQATDGQIYRVVVPLEILPGDPKDYNARLVRVKSAQMHQVDGTLELTVSDASQFQLN